MKNTRNNQSNKYLYSFIKLVFALAVLSGAARASDTYFVFNTNNSGQGSLRQAIIDVNNYSGTIYSNYKIIFDIPGNGVKTINLTSPLPEIYLPNAGCFDVRLTLDGTQMPNYNGVPRVELNGEGAGAAADGLKIRRGTLRLIGLAINRFSGWGVNADSNSVGSGPCQNQDAKVHTGLELFNTRIGTDVNGVQDLGNGGGVRIEGSIKQSVIGDTSTRNVISGNNGDGVYIVGTSTFLENNRIGTDFNGASAIPNGGNGVHIVGGSTSINIGTANTGGIHNVISGNAGHGIYLESGGVKVKNARIGVNQGGDADLGNGGSGVYLESIYGGTVVGGGKANEGNVISGNNQNGIFCKAINAVIQGNMIGTNAFGTAAIGNTEHGVQISEKAAQIGGLVGGEGNVISGNGGDGVRALKKEDDAVNFGSLIGIYGNLIGINATATGAIPNSGSGVQASSNNADEYGTAVQIYQNVIGGNASHGVMLTDAARLVEVSKNYIGVSAAGVDLGNKGNGVNAFSTADYCQVDENKIAYNDGDGVSIQAGFNNLFADKIAIRKNSIYSNGGLGIDLGPTNGVTPNDLKDFDAGPNGLQNFPVLQAASAIAVNGTLNSTPNSTFTVDVFRVDSCDASGYGEGRYYVGSIETTTDGQGNANFNLTGVNLSLGQTITATASQKGEIFAETTSEFSPCLTVNQTPGAFSLGAATYSVNESAGTVTVTVNRTNGSNTATVDYATSDGTAVAGQDYTATSGTLTFAPGAGSKTFTIPIINDASDEADQTFNVTLSNTTGGATLVNPSTAVITITDNDNPPSISINNVAVKEGNSGTTAFTFDVTLSVAWSFPVSVKWITSSDSVTATPGVDYMAADGTLDFAAGETSKSFTVLVNGDLVVETNEAFLVNLYAAVNATLADSQGLGTIIDDDSPGKLEFSAASYNVNENAGAINVQVTRTGGTAGTVTIDYATKNNGTATANTDFAPASGTFTFLDGEVTKVFQVIIHDDQTAEQTESINLALSNPTGGATLGANSNATVNILDNDTPQTVSISGMVKYVNTPIGQQQKYVPNAMMTAIGDKTVSLPSDSTGAYKLENLTSGSTYTVTPTKADDVNGITAFDATMILRHVAANGQGANALSINQQKAADANNDNLISAFDATQILRYVAANGQNANTGQVGNWKFLPASHNYQSIGNSLSGENFDAVLIGEINGDWVMPANNSLAEMDQLSENVVKIDESNSDAEISFPIDLSAANNGETLIVPVLLTNYVGRTLAAYSFDLRYDSAILQLDGAMPFDTTETLSQGLMVVKGKSKSGRIRIAAAGDVSSNNSVTNGVLLNLRFKVIGSTPEKAGENVALTFEKTPVFEDKDGESLKVKTTNGSIRLTAGDYSPVKPE
jgi:hypothetical protein